MNELRADRVLGIAFRAIAIWILLYALSQVNAAIWVLSHDSARPSSEATADVVLGFGLPLLTAIALWIWAYPLAALLCDSPREVVGVGLAASELERVVIFGVGIYLLATRISSLTYWFVFFSPRVAKDPAFSEMHPDYAASIARAAVELGLAVWLLRGAPGLQRIRGGSRSKGRVVDEPQ